MIGMRGTEFSEFLRRTADIERTGRFQSRHQYGFFGIENLCGFAHETNSGDYQHISCGSGTEPCHFKRISNATTGFFGQSLQRCVGIVMGNQRGVVLPQQLLYGDKILYVTICR